MNADLIARYSTPVPRYTSYPTALHFKDSVDAGLYDEWLMDLSPDAEISLYLHIPYCDRLCWFCGCHTRQVRRYEPVAAYLDVLIAEMALVARQIGRRQPVNAIHFGGGSPTMLHPDDLKRLDDNLRVYFKVEDNAEISIEIDPNDIDDEKLDAIAAIGVTRASLGVQDFDQEVQEAINRIQSIETTKATVDGLRARGIKAVNCDILYGLPHQTEDKILKTVDAVIALDPDRIALFGYAHVPWMKKHQRMIDEAALPDAMARFAQARAAGARLIAQGFSVIGMDHFARPDDPLAIAQREGKLHRNFQGYTTDQAETLLGLGASAIGKLRQGYVQNAVPAGDYTARITSGRLATVKGVALCHDDRVSAFAIEKIMCDFALSRDQLIEQFGDAARPVLMRAERYLSGHKDNLFIRDGEIYRVTERGRPFVRHFASQFDTYLCHAGRHSMAV